MATAVAVCVQDAYSDYSAATTAASAAYQSAVNQAQNEYDTGAQNENQQHATNLEIIANNLQAAIDAAQDDLEECLEDCPWVICGWLVFWVNF